MTEEKNIPHGHCAAHRRGIIDALAVGLEEDVNLSENVHETQRASYRRGYEEGLILKKEIADRERPIQSKS